MREERTYCEIAGHIQLPYAGLLNRLELIVEVEKSGQLIT